MKINLKKGERFNPYRTFNGIYIPEAVVMLPLRQLSQGAKLVYGRLCRYAGKDGRVFPRIDSIAHEVGSSPRQASSYLRELKDFGLIEAGLHGLEKSRTVYPLGFLAYFEHSI